MILRNLVMALLFGVASSICATAGIPFARSPYLHTDTAHFRILYAESLKDQSQSFADVTEEVYGVVRQKMGYDLSERITIIFSDSSDVHNGATTSIPHNTISIYVNNGLLPSSLPLLETDSNLRLTILHEMVHAFNLDLRQNYDRVMANIFGKVYPTNDIISLLLFYFTNSPLVFAPSWYLEGTATWSETALTRTGRGRNNAIDAIFRTQVRDQTLVPPEQWSANTPTWPQGHIVYIYGLRLMQFLADNDNAARHGTQNTIGRLTEDGSHRFLFNALKGFPALTGQDWHGLATEMLNQEISRQKLKLAQIAHQPLTIVPRLTAKNTIASLPIFIGNKIAYIDSPEERRTSLQLYDPATQQSQRISLRHYPMGSLATTADQRFLFYGYLAVEDGEDLYYHINRKDLVGGGETNITNRGRYTFFDISPDGQTLLATTQRAGKSSLVEISVRDAKNTAVEKVLYQGSFGIRLESPRYSPNGDIGFVRVDGQHRTINLLSRADGTVSTLWQGNAVISGLIWHPRKDQLIFSSDLSGVFNIYQLSIHDHSPPQPLTNVEGGLFMPAISADGQRLATVSLDGYGPYLTTLAYPAARVEPLPKITTTWTYPEPPPEITPQVSASTSKSYNSFTGIRYDFWSPWLVAASGGAGTKGGVQAHFSDALDYQDIFMYGGRDFKNRASVGGLYYTYRGLVPALTLYGVADVDNYPGLLTTPTDKGHEQKDYAERTRSFGISINQPLYIDLQRSLSLIVGAELRKRSALAKMEERVAESLVAPETGNRTTYSGKLFYDDTTAFNRSVSLERGIQLSIGVDRSRNTDHAGNDALTRVLTSGALFLPSFWDDHVIRLTGTYGTSHGSTYAQGAYGVGGNGDELALLNLAPLSNLIAVRGYTDNAQVGGRVTKAGISYRLPLWNVFRGTDSGFPFYKRSLFGEVFYEQGKAWGNPSHPQQIGWLHSAGVEVNYGMTLFRYMSLAPGIGIAYVPDNRKLNSDNHKVTLYISIKGWLSN